MGVSGEQNELRGERRKLPIVKAKMGYTLPEISSTGTAEGVGGLVRFSEFGDGGGGCLDNSGVWLP